MSLFESILLGIIQGLSEFLPISSTAHLTLAGRAMGLIDPTAPEQWTAFIAVVQLGTLAAILIYFRRDIISITGAFLRENLGPAGKRRRFARQSYASRSGWYVIFGTLPIAIIGLAFKDEIRGMFTKNLIVIGASLLVLGLVLEIAERSAKFNREISTLKMSDALWIGFAQALALIPGSSRSGTTITAGLFRGFTREAAARFSFLLSIPAIGASGMLEFAEALPNLDGGAMMMLLVATLFAGLSGYAAIWFLLRYLRTRTTRLFVIYRVVLGGGILLAILLGGLQP